jgi:hypothetical protein
LPADNFCIWPRALPRCRRVPLCAWVWQRGQL